MRVTFYGYNTFVVRSDDKKIVIDPGAELYFFRFLKSNLPRSEYNDVTHIFVTHADQIIIGISIEYKRSQMLLLFVTRH